MDGFTDVTESLVSSEHVIPFVISMIAIVAVLYYLAKSYMCKKHARRMFWILRRDKDRGVQPASLNMQDSTNNTSFTSEDEFIEQQDKYEMNF